MAHHIQPTSGEAPPAPVPRDGVLEEMTVDEVRALRPEVVVVPLGSTEPHGPHLPYGTDCWEVAAVARPAVALANRRGARAIVYPTLPITNNANMRKVPFALRIGVRTFMQVLIDIALQCRDDGVHKLVLVNGHGGNPPALLATLREIASMDDMPFVCSVNTWTLKEPGFVNPMEHPSDHGGESETSRMLHLRPDLVRTHTLAHNPTGTLKVKSLAQVDFVRPWHLYMPVTAAGETRASTAAKGKAVIDTEAAALADLLVELSSARWDDRFPYE